MHRLRVVIRWLQWKVYVFAVFACFVLLVRYGMDAKNPASVVLSILGGNAYWRLATLIYLARISPVVASKERDELLTFVNLFTGFMMFISACSYLQATVFA